MSASLFLPVFDLWIDEYQQENTIIRRIRKKILPFFCLQKQTTTIATTPMRATRPTTTPAIAPAGKPPDVRCIESSENMIAKTQNFYLELKLNRERVCVFQKKRMSINCCFYLTLGLAFFL